jgi:hypothetical protein
MHVERERRQRSARSSARRRRSKKLQSMRQQRHRRLVTRLHASDVSKHFEIRNLLGRSGFMKRRKP